MCGIAGLFLPKSAALVRPDIGRMQAVLRHRGPDGTGDYWSDDKRFAGGFTRLAIIDLATGDQPLCDRETGNILVGNGEIYNYVELRAQHADYAYRSAGDMETVLALERRYGDRLVDHLNGIYGLALYRRRQHELLLVRDRLGVKPVYWAPLRSGGIVFASEIKALFASGLVAPEIDEVAVSAYLAHGYVPAPGTLSEGRRARPDRRRTLLASGARSGSARWRGRHH